MADHNVTLNLDRNGNVTSVQPEAVVMSAGDSVIYTLMEPSSTNWQFLGVQFSSDAQQFSSISVNGPNQLKLTELANISNNDKIEVTLLYVLAETAYYAPGDDPANPPARTFKAKNSVHAFDPLIINQN